MCCCVLGSYLSSLLIYFFFSSRRRHTKFKCDWSSDVCSSDLSRSGEEITPRFVKRNGHNARIVIKCTLHPITMMGVEVDIQYLCLAGTQHIGNRNRNVVIDTEAGSPLGPGVMQPTARVKYMQGPRIL